MGSMATIASSLEAMAEDLKTRPEPSPLVAWPALATAVMQVAPAVSKLRARHFILKLRNLIDDAQLEEDNPFEEKLIHAVALETVAFEALDNGLSEESDLYQTAGEIVQRLKEEACEYDKEHFDDLPDDEDIVNDDEAKQPEDGKIELNVSYRVIRKRQRRASLTMSPDEVNKKWLLLQPSINTEYFYNTLTGDSQDTQPAFAAVVRATANNLRDIDPFLHKVIILQNRIRSWLCRKRLDSVRIQKLLRNAIVEARRTRDSKKLLEAIHSALDNGLDDESDVYFEAGALIEALEDEDTTTSVEARGGMEWTKMWDAKSQKYYYCNVVTLESSFIEPGDYDPELDTGIHSLPQRMQKLLMVQSAMRRVLRKIRISLIATSRPCTASTIQ